jgi:hypothetical protein
MVGIGFLSFIAMLAFAGLAIDKAPGGKAKGKTIMFVLASIVCGGAVGIAIGLLLGSAELAGHLTFGLSLLIGACGAYIRFRSNQRLVKARGGTS